uniref:Uncharacterized protein n=1 Tax=Romanomermis culicivorax TaxID=13658 RepID=A0A915K6S5_ROMCU
MQAVNFGESIHHIAACPIGLKFDQFSIIGQYLLNFFTTGQLGADPWALYSRRFFDNSSGLPFVLGWILINAFDDENDRRIPNLIKRAKVHLYPS